MMTPLNKEEYLAKELEYLETLSIDELHFKEWQYLLHKRLKKPTSEMDTLDHQALTLYWEKNLEKRSLPNPWKTSSPWMNEKIVSTNHGVL
jgi:hypothetical protein